MRKPTAILREMQMVKTNGMINAIQREQIISELQKELNFVLGQTELPLSGASGVVVSADVAKTLKK